MSRLGWAHFVGGGVLWTCFYAFMLNDVFDLPWAMAFVDSGFSNLLLALSVGLVFNTLRYYQPSANRFVFLLAGSVVLSSLVMLASHYGVEWMIGDDNALAFFEQTLTLRLGFALLANAAAIGLSMHWYSSKLQRETSERQEQTERLAKDAELFNLRNQLQPHFLFNSLNSINALISISPMQAREMVQQLSAFLRGTIRSDESTLVPFLEEIEHLNLYLGIEKVRFGHRLETKFTISESCHEAKIPPLLVQPLLENAIKFGLYGTTGDVLIELVARCEPTHLELSITNPTDGETSAPRGTGFGLTSIKRRLQLIYGRNDLLETTLNKNTFTATLKLPIQEHEGNRS